VRGNGEDGFESVGAFFDQVFVSADIEEVYVAEAVFEAVVSESLECVLDKGLFPAFRGFVDGCASVFFDCFVEFVALCISGNKVASRYNRVVDEW
jgi:hypothetical protein